MLAERRAAVGHLRWGARQREAGGVHDGGALLGVGHLDLLTPVDDLRIDGVLRRVLHDVRSHADVLQAVHQRHAVVAPHPAGDDLVELIVALLTLRHGQIA